MPNNNFEFDVGIDCEDIKRWRQMLPKLKDGPEQKLFSDKEHQYCQTFRDPAAHYASRWCAKEALIKAVSPVCKLDVRAIEVLNDQEGRPFFVISDPVVSEKNLSIRLSLSHSRETAIAMVVVFNNNKIES